MLENFVTPKEINATEISNMELSEASHKTRPQIDRVFLKQYEDLTRKANEIRDLSETEKGQAKHEMSGADKTIDLIDSMKANGVLEKKATDHEGIDRTAESLESKSDFERMENEITIKFKCPEGMDPKEFKRQLKAQEDGLNNMDVQQWLKNRHNYIENGRAPESVEAQKELREKARAERIEANMENGMSYEDASKEADDWLKTKAALHNPDQIAGGDPDNVSMMGDADVNKSIGSQWKGDRINTLESGIKDYAKGKTDDELARTKLNVRLEME